MSQRTEQLDRSYLTDLFHRVLLGWQVVLQLELEISRELTLRASRAVLPGGLVRPDGTTIFLSRPRSDSL